MNKTHSRAALIGILLFIFLVGTFSYMEYSRHQSLLIQEKKSEAERLFYYLQDYIEDKKDQLEIIANLWRRQPSSEQEEMFQEIAEETINVFPSYRFIHFIDTDLVIRHSAPQEEALHLIGRDVSQYEENIPLYEKMIETEKPVFSPIMWRPTSEIYSVHLWVPILLEGPELLGIISSDLDLSYIISKKTLETDLSHHSIKINISDIGIFRTDEREGYPVEVTHEIMGIPWTIGVYIDDKMSPSIVFLTGVLLSLLVSFSVYKMLIRNRELGNTKERLDNIIKGTHVGTWEWNVQTGEHTINQQWAEMIGYTLEELSPVSIETWMDYTHPEDLEVSNRMLEKHFAGEMDYYDVEYRMKHKEGHWVWVQDRGKVISWTEDGKPLWMFGTLQDVTEKKQTEELLQQQQKETKEAHQRLLTVLDSVAAGINVTDMDTYEILYVNEFTKNVHGDVTGELCWQVFQEGQLTPCDFCTNPKLLDSTGKPVGVLKSERYNEKMERWYECHDIAIEWIDRKIVRLEMAYDITEHKQMEEQLRENEQRIKLLSDNLPDGMVYQVDFGKDGSSRKFTYVSAGVERLHGVAPSEATQDASLIYGKVIEEDLPLLAQKEAECMANMSNFQMEFRVRRPSGEIRWHMVSSSPRRLANNHLVWDGFEIDITERKQMEDALITSEKRLNTMLNNTPDMVVRFNKDLQHIYCNETVEREFGIPADFFIGKTFLDLEIPDQEAEKFKSMHQSLVKCLETGEKQYYDTELMTPSGLKYYSTVIIPEKNNKSIESLLAVTRDITEQKQAEKKREELSAEYETVFQSTQDVLFLLEVVDEDTFRYIRNNLAYNQATGLTLKDIQGKTPEELRGKELGSIIRAKYKLCVEKKEPISYEETLDLPGGKFWSTILTPILENGRVVSIVGSSRDITERKQMEQKLIQRNQEIEQLNQHLNQEIEKAHQIHNIILPKELPNIEGINFAAFYQPAETLGGDFYEVIQSVDKLVMYLSDISGHGLEGSMINFFVKEAIDSYITLKPEDVTPRSILWHLERQFRKENYPGEFFICIFLAVLDLESMELTYTGAGFQDTPFVKQGNGDRVKLSTKGLFINGTFPVDKENFQENTITLTPGSTIFFNTDGLTEQGEPDKFYRDRLPQVFYENSHLPPDEIAQALVEDFKSFNNGSMQGNDDITFLILQVEPENKRYQLELTTDFLELEDLRKNTVAFLPDVDEADVLLNCLYELTANAMEHGNQMDPTKKVMVDLIISHDFIQVSVEDEGAGFNWREKIDNPFDLEGLTERGRGIAMTRILCDGLYYNDTGNKVTCVVHLSQGGGVCK